MKKKRTGIFVRLLRRIELCCHNRWFANDGTGPGIWLAVYLLFFSLQYVFLLYVPVASIIAMWDIGMMDTSLLDTPEGNKILLQSLVGILLLAGCLVPFLYITLGGRYALTALKIFQFVQVGLFPVMALGQMMGFGPPLRGWEEVLIRCVYFLINLAWLLYFFRSKRLRRAWNVTCDDAALPEASPAGSGGGSKVWRYALVVWMLLMAAGGVYNFAATVNNTEGEYIELYGGHGLLIPPLYVIAWLYGTYRLLRMHKRALNFVCGLCVLECLLGLAGFVFLVYFAVTGEPFIWGYALLPALLSPNPPQSPLFWLPKLCVAWFFYVILSRRIGALWRDRWAGEAVMLTDRCGREFWSRFYSK